jgi:hypothetical protein
VLPGSVGLPANKFTGLTFNMALIDMILCNGTSWNSAPPFLVSNSFFVYNLNDQFVTLHKLFVFIVRKDIYCLR